MICIPHGKIGKGRENDGKTDRVYVENVWKSSNPDDLPGVGVYGLQRQSTYDSSECT